MRLALILIAEILFAFGGAALARDGEPGHWKLQYFYDQYRSTFIIADLKFPSSKKGMAVGAISDTKSFKPTFAVTSDGGAHWTLAALQDTPESVFFLNDSLGWIVTAKGIWRTEEFGKSWRKLASMKGLARVYFVDADHGWAVGARKQIYETRDGGTKWTAIPELEKVKSSEENTHFAWIEFANKETGIIGGWSKPPRRSQQTVPDWLDPEMASNRREWPQLGILLDTHDAGKTWSPTTMSLFGEITALRLSPARWSLALVEFSDAFDWPSEVFYRDWKVGVQERVFREANRKITDVAIASPNGPSYLAGVEHFGKLQQLPIPQKVVILRSEDHLHWTEMPVDYRATAHRVILTAVGPDDIWAATDTGMILKLTQ